MPLERAFPSSLLSHVKEIPGLLTLDCIFLPKEQEDGDGTRGLRKMVTSKAATTRVYSLGSGWLARGTSLQAVGCPPSVSHPTSL